MKYFEAFKVKRGRGELQEQKGKEWELKKESWWGKSPLVAIPDASMFEAVD